MSDDGSFAVCPLCGRLTPMHRDGTLVSHDFHPNCRALCAASWRPIAEAQAMAELRDYARERARILDGHA